MFDRELAKRFHQHISQMSFEEIDERASKASSCGMNKVIEENIDLEMNVDRETLFSYLLQPLEGNPLYKDAAEHIIETFLSMVSTESSKDFVGWFKLRNQMMHSADGIAHTASYQHPTHNKLLTHIKLAYRELLRRIRFILTLKRWDS